MGITASVGVVVVVAAAVEVVEVGAASAELVVAVTSVVDVDCDFCRQRSGKKL